MCFSATMSAVLAFSCWAVAAYEHSVYKCPKYTMGIAYWGLMEFLQTIQHFYAAEAEDGYAMCRSPINRGLTVLGVLHVIFQPLFTSYVFMSLRHTDIAARIEGDLVSRLCFLMGLWWMLSPFLDHFIRDEPSLTTPATEDCPNYAWLAEGYDGALGHATPNMPGVACTYYAPTRTGHLAWAVPSSPNSYFFPTPSVHFFCMFFPYLIMIHRPFVQAMATFLLITGPVFAAYITPSVNEQPAIWCFFSIFEVILTVGAMRWYGFLDQPPAQTLVHPGGMGEEPLTYVLSVPDIQKPLLSSEESKSEESKSS